TSGRGVSEGCRFPWYRSGSRLWVPVGGELIVSAVAALAVKSWKAGRYTCTLTLQRPRPTALVNAVIEWAPEQPKRLTDAELAEYRAGRNKAMADLSQALGINAAVVE